MTLEAEDTQGSAPNGKGSTTSSDSSDDGPFYMIGELPSSIVTIPDLKPLENLTEKEYTSGRTPRFGKANPEIIDVPFWSAMMAAQLDPYTAYEVLQKSSKLPHYNNTDDFLKPVTRNNNNKKSDPRRATWTFAARIGRTITELPDGRLVLIGGEHEDHYDPDFHVYNHVCVYDKNSGGSTSSSSSSSGGDGGGRSPFVLYGYPRTVFPPTDFHTATLVEGKGTPNIYIIGCMGYNYQQRSGETPVYRLDTRDFSMHAVKTSGEKPGWISSHDACLSEDGTAIRVWGEKNAEYDEPVVYVKDGQKQGKVVDFEGEYLLHLATGRWTKLS
ncbi:hypothetical protein PG985_003099 [Apiospora marii]|uniref:uncharacterized protein n=1 Tax=Apiospora marii TaxID=335849 RepID=UPI00312FAC41